MDDERLQRMAEQIARIDERTEWLVSQARQQDDLTAQLAGRVVALETRQDHADRSRNRMRGGLWFGMAVVLAYVIEQLLGLI